MMFTHNHSWGITVSLVAMAAIGCGSITDSPPGGERELARVESALTLDSVDLIAIGSLSGQMGDLATQTAAPLENGVAGNLLGGLGSGIAYAGGITFLAVPDRGPNNVAYDSAVDDTVSYLDRFQTLGLVLRPSRPASALPFNLGAELDATTLLFDGQPLVYGTGADVGLGTGAPALNDASTFYLSGRSDNFEPTTLSTDPSDARLDPESIRASADGASVYISDEYGPYIYEFDRASGKRKRTFSIPDAFAVSNQSPRAAVEISTNTSGRVASRGMEGLAITPDGQTLVGAMQSPLLQDGGTAGRFTRIVTVAVTDGASKQFAYELTNVGTDLKPKYTTVSEIVAINDHELLVDERDSKGLTDDSVASFKRLFKVDVSNAIDVTGISGADGLAAMAVPKALFLDIVAVLTAHGISAADIPAKIEGLAFGPDVRTDASVLHTLYVSNDNDFRGTVTDLHHPDGIDNPNQFFVFGIPATALPTYVPQELY